MGLTNSIQRIRSASLPILVWANILLTTLSCIKFHASYGVREPVGSETTEKLQSLALLAANMGITITKANEDLVLHEFFQI